MVTVAGKELSPTVVRFAGVGVINTAIDFGLFAALHGTLGITVANLISTAAGMTFSFVVNGLFTFKTERLTVRQALTFMASTGTVLLVIQPIVIHLISQALPASLPVDRVDAAKACSIGLVLVLNFLSYRYLVWRPGAPQRGESTTTGISRSVQD